MANYASLLATIAANITDNNTGAITGPVLKGVLDGMVGSLGTGYQFMGVAATSTNPGTPDQKVYYLAGPGTYTNFNNITVADGEIAVLKYDSAWSKVTTPMASAAEVSQLGQNVDELKVIIDGQFFDNPTSALSGGYMGGSGAWVEASGYYYAVINVIGVRGCHISGYASQYAFLKSFSNSTSTPSVFVEGGSRVTGTLSNVLIPDDANYLYVFYGTTQPTSSTLTYTISETLKDGLDEAVDALSEEVGDLSVEVEDLSDEVNGIVVTSSEQNVTIKSDTGFLTYTPNSYAGQNGMTASQQYESWTFFAPNDFQLYMSSQGSGGYMQLCVYPSGAFGDANYHRYRNSDSNLPTSASPLSITQGTMIIISTNIGNTTWSYVASELSSTKLSNNVGLNSKHLEQVSEYLATDVLALSYSSGVLSIKGAGVECKFSDLDFNNAHGVFELQDLSYNGKTIFGTENDYLGPIRIHGESIKGAKHGSELTDSVRVFADGVELADGDSVSARSVSIYVTSTIGTDEFSRTTCWSFNGKSLLISSVLKTLKALNIDYVFGAGIISSVDTNTIAWLNKDVLTSDVLMGLNESTMIVTTAGNLLSRRLSINSGYGDHRVAFTVYTGRKKLYYYTCYGSDIAVPSGSVFASSAELVFS